jgi:hypothetical protein
LLGRRVVRRSRVILVVAMDLQCREGRDLSHIVAHLSALNRVD